MPVPEPFPQPATGSSARPAYQQELLTRLLQSAFGGLDEGTLAALGAQLEWLHLRGGETLLREGEAGDAMYLVVSGRLRAFARSGAVGLAGAPSTAAEGGGPLRRVRDIGRGQIIGEMALVSGEPRAATVAALRDSVLVRLQKRGFDELMQRSPQASMALMRQLVQRLQHAGERPAAASEQTALLERPVVLGLVAVSEGVDPGAFATDLARELRRFGRVRVVSADVVDLELGQPGLARADGAAAHDLRTAEGPVAMLLDQLEASSDFLLLVADADAGAWTGRCCRHADELLLIADAQAPPRLHAIEERFLQSASDIAAPTLRADALARERQEVASATRATEVLVLLHPARSEQPQHTAAWLAGRDLHAHVHLRRGHAADLARLARLAARQALGLVLGGGGARGFAHLGLMQALAERGIEVDVVGGASIGAAMAAFLAADRPLPQVLEVARCAFAGNPTGDLNPFPLLSLFRGRRLRQRIAETEQALYGRRTAIEDLWKGFFSIATNVTRAEEVVFERGPLTTAVLASLSIPGALPPVLHQGELLCDGGTFNNFPADVMRRMYGVGFVIGVDLASDRAAPPELSTLSELPGSWALLLDRLRPRAHRRYRLPSITAYLMRVTTLYSQSRRSSARSLCDLYLNPRLAHVGMLEWDRFEAIVQEGRAHGLAVLDVMPAPVLARLRGER